MTELFFYTSKLLWVIVSPDNLFVILLSLSLILFLFNQRAKALILLSLLTFSVILISVFPIGGWMFYPLERQFETNPKLPEKIDGVIILGGSVYAQTSKAWQQLETNEYGERLSEGIKLALKFPDARLVFTGGNAGLDRDAPTEAEFVKQHLMSFGIASERILIEAEARNTAENASLTKRLVKPLTDENWILVTTAFHMPRSIGVFCKQGWSVIPYPVDHQTVPEKAYTPSFSLVDHASDLVKATHEWLGLLAYYKSGKTDELIPQQCTQSN